MRSTSRGPEQDLTARAAIREAALRLFARRGPEVVTVREVAAEAEVSPALVMHHFGSKAGLREAVDERVSQTFEEMVDALGEADLVAGLSGDSPASLAELFVSAFPADSPIPAYLRWLLLTDDPVADTVFARWVDLTERVLAELEAAGVARPSADRRVRAAFLLVNDLAALLLSRQIGLALDLELQTGAGMGRWAAEVVDVYAHGAFRPATEGEA